MWTTTPWTLPANVALAVHPELDYARVQVGDEVLIVSKGTLGTALPGSPARILLVSRARPLDIALEQ